VSQKLLKSVRSKLNMKRGSAQKPNQDAACFRSTFVAQAPMNRIFPRSAGRRSWRRQGVGILCCLLGMLWLSAPNFHSFSHLVGLPHQHPDGSVHSHGPGETANHRHPHSHGGSPHVHPVGEEAAEGTTPSEQKTPDREPDDRDAPLLNLHLLEMAGCDSDPYDLGLDQALPVSDEPSSTETRLFSSAQCGTLSARGPPLSTAPLSFQLI